MLIVHVFVNVKSNKINEFIKASLENAKNSIKESGIARFDVCRNKEHPAKFVLVEVYKTADDPARHKETAHYQKWRDTVADMMVEPRQSVKYENLFPADNGW
jgi:autoinducer 2-degrading protein